VKFVCVDELHAAFLNESRTRRRCLVPRTGNPGQAHVLGLEWDNSTQCPNLIRGIYSSLHQQPMRIPSIFPMGVTAAGMLYDYLDEDPDR
jgi:hypothetical protein